MAYILLAALTFWFFGAMSVARGSQSLLNNTLRWPFVLVLVQVTLGIITVLSAPMIIPGKFGTFEILAELHQLVATFLLMSLVVNLYVVKRRN